MMNMFTHIWCGEKNGIEGKNRHPFAKKYIFVQKGLWKKKILLKTNQRNLRKEAGLPKLIGGVGKERGI